MCSSKVLNNAANFGDAWHDKQRVKTNEDVLGKQRRRAVPPKLMLRAAEG